jgi:hypothetical protein
MIFISAVRYAWMGNLKLTLPSFFKLYVALLFIYLPSFVHWINPEPFYIENSWIEMYTMEKMLYMANIFYIWSSGVSSGSVSRKVKWLWMVRWFIDNHVNFVESVQYHNRSFSCELKKNPHVVLIQCAWEILRRTPM